MDNIQTLVLKISQEVNMNMEETEMLQHDIWNLRGHEWAEVVRRHCTKETQELFEKLVFKSKTKRLHISMAYTYVGDTGIDIPLELLEGKTEEEQYKIAYQYAQEHIGEIPVARNADYVADSDNFEMDDIEWEEE